MNIRRGIAAVTCLLFAGGCGTAVVGRSAPTSSPSAAETSASSEPSQSATDRPTAEPPANFLDTMARHGYMLQVAKPQQGEVESAAAIESAQAKYGLFSKADPASADLYQLTTPNEGPLENPEDPNSDVATPKYQDTPVWVVYARAEMLKDDSDPSLGLVTGTVVVFVDAKTGEAREAITY